MRGALPACPKCTGQLFLEHEAELHRGERPEAVCLQCGWRRTVRLQRAAPPLARPLERSAA